MKQLIQIYWRDLKAIIHNYAALVVVVTLCILPSLYAWFNIKASWDPYGKEATSGIKVAVVNQDQGTDFQGKDLNIGNTVVSELKENTQLGWQFVTEEEGLKALREERYYAMITIPEDFSASLVSIVSGDITKGRLIYTVNEKMNAIAPKLTDKGVSSLQSMISKTVVETVSNTIFEVANEIGMNLEEEIPNLTRAYEKLLVIQSKFGAINQAVDQSATGVGKLKTLIKEVNADLPTVDAMLTDCKALAQDAVTFVNTAKTMSDELAPIILEDLSFVQHLSANIADSMEQVQGVIEDNIEAAPEVIAQMQSKVATLQKVVQSLSNLLGRLNHLSSNQPFLNVLDKLNVAGDNLLKIQSFLSTLQERVESGDLSSEEILRQLVDLSRRTAEGLNQAYVALQDRILPMLDGIFTDADTAGNEVIAVLDSASGKLPQVSEALQIADSALDSGEKGVAFVKENLPRTEELIEEIVTKMGTANTEEGLRDLVDLLKADVTARSDFLATPVVIENQTLYPMQNYGTSMTPFYTVLSLWVGILLLCSILTTEAHGEYKSYQVYFGKFLLFATITSVQALIVALGDLYLLGIYCRHPVLFVLGNIATSIMFTAIVYSLVSVFGNVGKVIAIILMVLQVAGSGGTFPIQLTPKFFQNLNPWLPFTYCISVNREAIGGVVQQVLQKDFIIMACYIGIFLIGSILFKKPINRLLSGFVRKFSESGIGEH
ncbi:MAG: YhgE/Pip domain-containing protein [Lachnospiraceae bacterium]|nr:YhgE/Pip domain-containing protein [Lachnospiraceae bacterium]